VLKAVLVAVGAGNSSGKASHGSETTDLQPEDVEVGRASIDLACDAAITTLDAINLARDAVNLANDGVVEALDEVNLVPVQTGVTAKFSGLIFS
jgi:hypothetical protein